MSEIITEEDLEFVSPGYYSYTRSDVTGNFEYAIEPLPFGRFMVAKYYLSAQLVRFKIKCNSFEEALLKLNELVNDQKL
jgi:hypothetical protein